MPWTAERGEVLHVLLELNQQGQTLLIVTMIRVAASCGHLRMESRRRAGRSSSHPAKGKVNCLFSLSAYVGTADQDSAPLGLQESVID
ncbi:MAG: hypothetical protein ACLVJ6_03685 [Merdibacter sp.]